LKDKKHKEKQKLADSLGSGGANKAANALLNRRRAIDEALGESSDEQMNKAIEMVRKKKSAKRTDY
jgi:hypothetical protein